MIGQFRQSVFTDANLSLFQQALNDQFSAIGQVPFINGSLLTDVILVTGQINTINHKLGRKLSGYFVFLKSSNANIWNDPIVGDRQLLLRCSANTTVNLWVF